MFYKRGVVDMGVVQNVVEQSSVNWVAACSTVIGITSAVVHVLDRFGLVAHGTGVTQHTTAMHFLANFTAHCTIFILHCTMIHTSIHYTEHLMFK